MTIATILKAKGRPLVSMPPDLPADGVVRILLDHRIGAAPVLAAPGDQAGSLLGMVSERDLVHALARLGGRALGCTAGELMTTPVITIPLVATVADAMELMTDRRVRHLPVVHDDRLVGLVSIGDLVKRRIEEAEQEASALKHYITAS